jgi:GAF domain-containing protein
VVVPVSSMADPVEGRSAARVRAALDELGLLVLGDESMYSVLQKVVDLVKPVMPPGAEASITLLRDDQATTGAFTGQLAVDLDEMQYERGHGPCLEAAIGGEVIEIVDARHETRWPDYVPIFVDRGALSSVAVPVPAAQLSAALNVYAPVARGFTDADRQTLGAFAAHAAVALTNVDLLQNARELAEHLQAAMVFRSVIEQAKGILMERNKVTPDQAFRLLVESSMATNRKVRDIADTLVTTGELVR